MSKKIVEICSVMASLGALTTRYNDLKELKSNDLKSCIPYFQKLHKKNKRKKR